MLLCLFKNKIFCFFRRLVQCLLFVFLTPVVFLSMAASLVFGKIYYEQIALNCSLENLQYLPAGWIIFGLVFFILWVISSGIYCYIHFAGWPEKIRPRLDCGQCRILVFLDWLYLLGCLELSYWFLFSVFEFPCPGSSRLEYSDYMDSQYVPVTEAVFQFPEKKRNLVYIVSESLENSYHLPEFFGEDLLPELTLLKKENLSFPGCVSVRGTDCTIMSLYAGQFALPYIPYECLTDTVKVKNSSIPFEGLNSLFGILGSHGYSLSYMQGGKIDYAGKCELYQRFPNIRIHSWETLKKDPEYRNTEKKSRWGVHDRVLFRHAKNELMLLAAEKKPFALQLLTVDSHCPSMFIEKHEPRKFNDYRDVCVIQSRMIYEFVDWLKQQPFFEDTLVVITGDHVAFDAFLRVLKVESMKQKIQRTVYNCFINSLVLPEKPEFSGLGRLWAMFDLMPTVLEAMGVSWQSHRLGVGTSLFSGERTWLEKTGMEHYMLESGKRSKLYFQLLGQEKLFDPVK